MSLQEDSLSAWISKETFQTLTTTGSELECPRMVAAMITGELDGLARYVMSIQTSDMSADDLGGMLAEQFTRFLNNHSLAPRGNA